MPRVLMYHLFNPIHKSIFKSVLSLRFIIVVLTHKNYFRGAQKKLYLWHEIFHCAYSHWLDHNLSPGARISYVFNKKWQDTSDRLLIFHSRKLITKIDLCKSTFLILCSASFTSLRCSTETPMHWQHEAVHKINSQLVLINKLTFQLILNAFSRGKWSFRTVNDN